MPEIGREITAAPSGDVVSPDLVRRLRAMVARKLSDPADVDDVVQEVLLKVTRDGGSVSPLRFWGWLKRVIYTTVNDAYRAGGARRSRLAAPAEVESLVDETAAADDPRAEHPLLCCLPAFMDRIPEEERELLRAIELEGIAQRDLAAARKLPYSTLKSRVQKARASLKREIIACCEISLDARNRVVDADPRGRGCGEEGNCPA
jgi:RNA polymerase sigma-70 factor (ECF subfamily)